MKPTPRTWLAATLIAATALALGAGALFVVRAAANRTANATGTADDDDAVLRYAPAASSVPAALADAGWPNLFGPLHVSVSPEQGITTDWTTGAPRELWRRAIGTGYSSPVVLGERLILLHRLGDEEIVACLDADTGQPRWEFRYPTHYKCQYRYSSGPYSTPIIDAQRVYAVGAEGVMRCLRADDGSLLWKRDLSREYGLAEGLFAVGATPLLDDGRLIFNLGAADRNAGIVALDAKSGETLWTATDHRAGYATPIAATMHGRRLVFVVTYEGLVALDPADGRVWWSVEHRPMAPDSVNATSPVVDGDLVLLVTGPGPGSVCLRVLPDGGYEEVWRDRRVLDSQFNPLVTLRGYVFGFTSSRQGGASLRCIELATGRCCWSFDSDLDRGTLLAADGKLLVLGEQGHLAALSADPRQARLLAITQPPLLAAPCYSAPALHRGLLYLRNEETLLCLDLRSK